MNKVSELICMAIGQTLLCCLYAIGWVIENFLLVSAILIVGGLFGFYIGG